VEAEKHNPKVAENKQEYGDQGQGDGKDGYDSSKQLPYAHNHKDEFQDQFHASTPEAMPKNLPIASSNSRYSDYFQNLHDGDGFATYVVTMEGPLERPIEIRTSAIVLDFFLTRAHFALSSKMQWS
jgi:hypothetical protein